MRICPLRALLCALLSTASLALAAQPLTEAPQRYLVKLRAGSEATAAQPAEARVRALAAAAGLQVIEARHIVAGIHLLRASGPGLAALRADPRVEYVEPDQRRYAQATPDDPLFAGQWFLQSVEPAAIDAVSAWDLTTGSNGVVIAELDTGVRFEHPDLRSSAANRLLPGYDMIGADAQAGYLTANDGDGRDPDASDPGDWVSANDLKQPLFATCKQTNSSWHGTKVAGILGAISNNASGVAGVTWSGWILPVRVLGKCGGYDSDILAAMGWAAGLPVTGVPNNPYPAQIINMSLGATGACPGTYQTVVDQLVALGVLIVVAAGNEGGPVDAPANCHGVAAVAGLRQVGTKVGFSSLGPQIALSAPAGNCVNTGAGQPCLFSINTTANTGTTVPAASSYTDQTNFNVGTSFSAPIVAGIAGLMLAVNGNLSAGQLISRLQLGATKPFPSGSGVPVCHVPSGASDLQTSECSCTTATCGAGMANAHGAVLEALRPIAAVSLPAQVSPGATVLLDASGSAAACGARLSTYAWSVVSPSSNPPPLQNAQGAQASLSAPTGNATYQLLLTVTDDSGRTDSAAVVVTSSSATSSAPARAGANACLTPLSYTVSSPAPPPNAGAGAGTGGGGGGALDLVTLALLGLAYARRSAAFSHSRCARR